MAWRPLLGGYNPVRVNWYGSASRSCREALATPGRDPRSPPDDLFRPGLRSRSLLPQAVLRPLPAPHGHGRPARRQAGTDRQVHDRAMYRVRETQTVCAEPLLVLLREPTVTGGPMSNVLVVADLHLGHRTILRHAAEAGAYRGGTTVAAHDAWA